MNIFDDKLNNIEPSRQSIGVMMRFIGVMVAEKNIPFMQLVGNPSVYTLIVQLRNENFDKFKNIITGQFRLTHNIPLS